VIRSFVFRVFAAAILVAAVASFVHGEVLDPEIRLSTDISTNLGGVGLTDHDVAIDRQGVVSTLSVAGIEKRADLTAYHRLSLDEHLMSFDITVEVAGLTVQPHSVMQYDIASGGTSIVFDGSSLGLPKGVGIDALTQTGDDLVVSFDIAVQLGGTTYADEDLIRWDGAVFSMVFDGSTAGVPEGLDVDATHLLASGNLLLSFDTGGSIGSVRFKDEDILEHDPGLMTWQVVYVGSRHHPDLNGSDIDAVFATVSPSVIFADDFETGDPNRWSTVVN